jgi:hypothetical protein
VIANGISSHCVGFRHHPHHHHGEECGPHHSGCGCHECCKDRKCGKEDDVCGPENEALRGEVHRLSRSVHRLSSLIRVEEPHRDKKEIRKAEEDEGKAARTTAATKPPKRK